MRYAVVVEKVANNYSAYLLPYISLRIHSLAGINREAHNPWTMWRNHSDTI